jgi:hypothetical protein
MDQKSITAEQMIFLVMGMLLVPIVGGVGGFGTIINLFDMSPIKSWERTAVVFEVLALSFASIILNYVKPFGLVRWRRDQEDGRDVKFSSDQIVRWLFVLAVPVTLVVSLPIGYDKNFSHTVEQFNSDKDFFTNIDERMEGSSVFAFPVEYFPEGAEVCQSTPYASLTGYMHTKTIRWNAGAIVGRELGWQAAINAMSIEEAANRLSDLDFSGMVFDKKGYSPSAWRSLMGKLVLNSRSQLLRSKDSRWVFVKLTDLFSQTNSDQSRGGFERIPRAKESTLLLSASIQQLKDSYSCLALR